MPSLSGKLRVAVVGAGYVSSYHVRAAQSLPFCEVVAVVDPDQEKARALAERFAIPRVFASLEELTDERVDVVHILTPPALHARLAIRALDMGYHVFVEKPMAETVEDCDAMIDAAQRAGRVLSVNHSVRFDPVVTRALDMVRSGAIGDVLSVTFLRNSKYDPFSGGRLPAHYRKGSYAFQDQGVHGLYMMEAFLGPAEKLDVKFRATGQSVNLLLDEWFAHVECARGAGQMYISFNTNPMMNEFIVHGTKGTLHIDAFLQTLVARKMYPAPKPIQRVIGVVSNALHLLWRVPLNAVLFVTKRLVPSPGIHVSVVRFYEALYAGVPVPVQPEEGRRMLALLTPVTNDADFARDEFFREFAPRRVSRILVTGAQGFLGSALVRRLLERGERVRVLLRRRAEKFESDPQLEVVYGDLGDPDAVDRAVEGVEVVYHVGAAMKGGPMEFRGGTVEATRNVVDSVLRHRVRRLVYVSSMSVLDFAGRNTSTMVNEESGYEPHPNERGLYTQTKLEAERMVLDAVRDHHLPAVVLRPGQIFGPGAEHVSPTGTIGLAGRWIVVGSGKAQLPLVFVEDVVDALLLAEEREEAVGQVIQIVDQTHITQNDYVAAARASRPEIKAVQLPKWFMMLAALGVEILGKVLGRAVPLTRYRVKSLRPPCPCDITRARQLLGWAPRIGAKQGIEITYPPRNE